MVEGCFGIALSWIVGVQGPQPVQLAVELLGFFLGQAQGLMIDLGTADQPGTHDVGTQSGNRRAGDQVVAHGIAGTSHQHAALGVVEVAPGATQTRYPTGNATQHPRGATPTGFDAASAALGDDLLPLDRCSRHTDCFRHQLFGSRIPLLKRPHGQIPT
ncbi:hypothetical protein D3C76_1304470 [compost metagenome]